VRWKTVKGLLCFGGKTLIPSVSRLLLNQTTNIMIVAYLGPAALALYARPRSLVLHLNTLVGKMSMTLTPTVSSLQSANKNNEIRGLLIASVKYSLYIILPIILVFIVFGDVIMLVWMGQRYANGLILAILAIGHLTALAQRPVLSILAGLNAHGRAGLAGLIASLCSVGFTILVLGYFKFGFIGISIALTLPLTIMNVAYLSRYVCRLISLDVKKYFRSVTSGPILYISPFAACLVVSRFTFSTRPQVGFAVGGAVGSAVLALLYWRYVLPDRFKVRVLNYSRKLLSSEGIVSTTKEMTKQGE